MTLPEPASHLNALTSTETGQRPATLQLHDVTLREGEQAHGVSFPLEAKIELALALEAAGVRRIQVGYPGRFERDAEAVAAVGAALHQARVEAVALAFVPDWEREIDACLASGAPLVNVVYRASDRLHSLLGVSAAQAVRRAREAVVRAVEGGASVAFTPSDSTRAELDVLDRFWAAAAEAGARLVYVADSMGAATPELMAMLVRRATATTGLPVGVHCHDDFGLVVANSLAGVLAGAEIADVAVNGLGDRAGNAPLEEVVAALALLYGIDAGVDLAQLTSLSQRFANAAGRPLHPGKPVTGPDVFAHVLPTHVEAIRRDPRSIQPYEPELVGNRGRTAPRAE
jgi:isopropylmalate/homocitrate/citramalate synthase